MAVYCAITDVQNRLSAAGVTLRTDDTPPTTHGDVLDEASRIIDEHCQQRYDPANLATSTTVKHWTANVAAFLLCERRGNPVPIGIAHKYERTLKQLERVLLHGLVIPDIAARRADAPVLRQGRIRLDPYPRTVIEPSRSTGQPEGYTQQTDYTDYGSYLF